MSFPDLVRLLVIGGGGFIVGGGTVILFERAEFYRRADLPDAARAMYALAFVNALVLAFIAVVLIDRLGQPLSWRWAIAIVIFAAKAYFMVLLRSAGLEQERRLLYGDRRERPLTR